MQIVNSLWVGDYQSEGYLRIGEPLSPLQIISINSFIQKGFQYNLYVYGVVENIPKGVNVIDGNEILPESCHQYGIIIKDLMKVHQVHFLMSLDISY